MKIIYFLELIAALILVKGHSDFKVKCLTFGLYTQVSDSGPQGPLVSSGLPYSVRELEQIIARTHLLMH